MSAADGIPTASHTLTEILARRSMERPAKVLIDDDLAAALTAPNPKDTVTQGAAPLDGSAPKKVDVRA